MWLLSVDRSSPGAGAALFRDGELAGLRRDAGEPARAPGWMAEVADLLRQHGVTACQLGALCAGVGPGSFSGVRSSLAALQGLALPQGVAVYGVSSAAALAFRLLSAPGAPEAVAVVGDARRERYWVAAFRLAQGGGVAVVGRDGGVRAVSHTADDFELVPAGDVAAAVPSGAWVAGPDFSRIGARLTAALGAGRVCQEAVYPGAESVGRLFLASPESARQEPLPVYLHPAVAERA